MYLEALPYLKKFLGGPHLELREALRRLVLDFVELFTVKDITQSPHPPLLRIRKHGGFFPLALFSMKSTGFVAYSLAAASMASAYPITADSVNCRSGPSTTAAVERSYAVGTDVEISCQTEGTNIFGNSIWDKTSDGCYVSDYYVKTGIDGYVTDTCDGSPPPTGGACKALNTAGIDLIKQWEGFVASPEPDPIGLPTVGYGHLCEEPNCAEVEYEFPLTEATATQLLNDDIPEYSGCLAGYLNTTPKLNDNQWAALTSWVFNVGCGNAETSTLVKRLNEGEDPDTVACEELPKWRLAGGEVLQGLVNRRKAEIKLFKTPSSKGAYPECE